MCIDNRELSKHNYHDYDFYQVGNEHFMIKFLFFFIRNHWYEYISFDRMDVRVCSFSKEGKLILPCKVRSNSHRSNDEVLVKFRPPIPLIPQRSHYYIIPIFISDTPPINVKISKLLLVKNQNINQVSIIQSSNTDSYTTAIWYLYYLAVYIYSMNYTSYNINFYYLPRFYILITWT